MPDFLEFEQKMAAIGIGELLEFGPFDQLRLHMSSNRAASARVLSHLRL